MDYEFDFSKFNLGIQLKEFGLIFLISIVSIIFNFGVFDQDSTQYIYMALHFVNQPPLEFILLASHIAILNTFVRLIRPLVPFLAGWLNNIFFLGSIPPFSFASGYWQLPFGIINGVFSFFSTVLLYKLVYHFTEDSKKSIFAITLYNFSNIMFFNSMILIEGGTLFFSILMVYLFICKPFNESYLNSITMGISIGLAGLTRETLLISGIILFIGYSIYKIKELINVENFKKFLITGILIILIYGGYVLSLGIKTYLDCLYIFLNLNLSNILAFFVPQSFFSRIPSALSGIGRSMLNVFKYLIIFFIVGLFCTFFSNKNKEFKVKNGIYLISFFIPLILSPFVVERFLFPFYLVSIYICIEGIYNIDENKIWVLSIVVSTAILNFIFVLFFYPYTLWQQFTNIEIRNFLYYLILAYFAISIGILLYKKFKIKKE